MNPKTKEAIELILAIAVMMLAAMCVGGFIESALPCPPDKDGHQCL